MIKIKEAVIVEGKYDKIKLSSLIDGLIIETGGFQIFSDREKIELLRRLADTRGLLILTDNSFRVDPPLRRISYRRSRKFGRKKKDYQA